VTRGGHSLSWIAEPEKQKNDTFLFYGLSKKEVGGADFSRCELLYYERNWEQKMHLSTVRNGGFP
jgi:hypothetical protein